MAENLASSLPSLSLQAAATQTPSVGSTAVCKLAVVTGSSGGIGSAVVKLLLVRLC